MSTVARVSWPFASASWMGVRLEGMVLARRRDACRSSRGSGSDGGGGPVVWSLPLGAWLALGQDMSEVAGVIAPITLLGISFAVLIAPLTASVMSSVEKSDEGLASGVNNAASRVAQLGGVALAAGHFCSTTMANACGPMTGAKPRRPLRPKTCSCAKAAPWTCAKR